MKAAVTCAIVFFPLQIFSGENSRKQFESEMLSAQQREVAAREKIAQEQNQIESLKIEIQTVKQELNKASIEKYTITGYNEELFENSRLELVAIEKKLEALSNSTTIDLLNQTIQIGTLAGIVNACREQKIGRIASISNIINRCDAWLAQISTLIASAQQIEGKTQNITQSSEPEIADNRADSVVSSYGVQADTWIVREAKGNDCESLYKIAGYPDVYGDSEKWPVLYRANKELIDQNYQLFLQSRQNSIEFNPQDILFPGQVLKIPR